MVTTRVQPSSSNPNAASVSIRVRQQVIEVLELLQVPVPRHLLHDVLAARGTTVELGQLSAGRVADLGRPGNVIRRLARDGFGVLLDGA